jgi:hypothetical protein
VRRLELSTAGNIRFTGARQNLEPCGFAPAGVSEAAIWQALSIEATTLGAFLAQSQAIGAAFTQRMLFI